MTLNSSKFNNKNISFQLTLPRIAWTRELFPLPTLPHTPSSFPLGRVKVMSLSVMFWEWSPIMPLVASFFNIFCFSSSASSLELVCLPLERCPFLFFSFTETHLVVLHKLDHCLVLLLPWKILSSCRQFWYLSYGVKLKKKNKKTLEIALINYRPKGKFIRSTQEQRRGPWYKVSCEGLIKISIREPW